MLEIVNLVVREGGIACSYAFLGSVKPFLRVETFFCVGYLITVYTSRESNIFFYFDNLEPATGSPAPELEVKALKTVKLEDLEQVIQIEK